MANGPRRLTAIPIPGLPPESPGNYLASLGLLRVLARTWPSVRIAWHDDVLHVVSGPASLRELLDAVARVARRSEWTSYEPEWRDAQKKSTKARTGTELALWQAEAEETGLELLAAHLVPTSPLSFNPLLGSGGNAGRRDFSKGWREAVTKLDQALSLGSAQRSGGRRTSPDPIQELKALLSGQPTTWLLEKMNAASWFSDANKLFNSGQAPYREGLISPWAMLLACEGLPFLAGGASRRLGARARSVGAFPFTTRAAAPIASGEAGRDLAEFWAPIWERPMTLAEVRALFSRGRAEVRARGALTPSAFASAIVRRGVDAGISEFRRFVLSRTTSANTFEPRFEGTHRLVIVTALRGKAETGLSPAGLSAVLECVLDLLDRLPGDRKTGQRWRFVGLRGPIEHAMLRLTAAPDDASAACALLDAVAAALDRIDRNGSWRERRISWQPLPLEWLPALFGTAPPEVEARLALAVVSGFPAHRPLTLYRFGVVARSDGFQHPPSAPRRWVWGPGSLPRVLSQVLLRRTLDWASDAEQQRQHPARQGLPATLAEVSQWLEAGVDEELVLRWLSRLALFDWTSTTTVRAALGRPSENGHPLTGSLALYGLFHPLFDLRPLCSREELEQGNILDTENGARTPGAALALANLIRAGQIERAVRLAATRYAMARAPIAKLRASWSAHDPDRLLAALLLPASAHDRSVLIDRWLRPTR